jgi:hypothetical protein
MTTFDVSKVALGEPGKLSQGPVALAIHGTCRVQVEAFGANGQEVIGERSYERFYASETNGFLNAVHRAYADHYPLVLSPDDVWLAIAQGFAHHVNANAEKLRSRFVTHEGQKYIEIRRDDFVKGSLDNDWTGAFGEFSDRIAEHIGKKRDLVVSAFSTTGVVEKAASEIVLLDAMRQYFTYGMQTCCGIPSITLLGTQDDWRQIRERASALGELDHFVSATKGNADPAFWESFYKTAGGSGGPFVSGAVNAFFPYLVGRGQGLRPNDLAVAWQKPAGSPRFGRLPSTGDFPVGLAKVPFKWHYFATTYEMHFLGGFVGATQDPLTLAVRPTIGWGIADQEASKEGRSR